MPGRASPTAGRTIDAVAKAIDETLKNADAAVARAAKDLGKIGLRGPEAHARLRSLCDELRYAETCGTFDDKGVLVSEAPPEFIRVEGLDIGQQEHVRRVRWTHEPVLSHAFRSVEGTDAVVLAHPVFSTDGRALGAITMMARPSSLIGHAVKEAFPDGIPELYVMQPDGYLLFDADREEIGRNIFNDPMFTRFPELQQVVRRQTKEPEGTGEYTFLGRGLTPPVHKRVDWKTVGLHGTEWRVAVAEALEGEAPRVVQYREPGLPIPAEVGLHALIATADGYLKRLADELRLIAAEQDVMSGEWARIEAPLRRVSDLNPPGVFFFALPDGSYWTVQRGRGTGSLSGRPYFPKVLQGERIIGELAVGMEMGRYEAVVAVPVRGQDGRIIGLLGATMFLDELSARIRHELGLDAGMWFYAFDDDQRLALHPDPERVFLTAGELGPEVERWFTDMQALGEGVMTYAFEGRPRTLTFRRSPLTGWMYAFGFVGERASA